MKFGNVATEITATCNDTIAIADNALYIVIYYYYDFMLNYDYDYDYVSSIYSYYHIDLIHDYNIDSIKDCYIDCINISSFSVPSLEPGFDPSYVPSFMSSEESHPTLKPSSLSSPDPSLDRRPLSNTVPRSEPSLMLTTTFI
jgi:hypothetical protein